MFLSFHIRFYAFGGFAMVVVYSWASTCSCTSSSDRLQKVLLWFALFSRESDYKYFI